MRKEGIHVLHPRNNLWMLSCSWPFAQPTYLIAPIPVASVDGKYSIVKSPWQILKICSEKQQMDLLCLFPKTSSAISELEWQHLTGEMLNVFREQVSFTLVPFYESMQLSKGKIRALPVFFRMKLPQGLTLGGDSHSCFSVCVSRYCENFCFIGWAQACTRLIHVITNRQIIKDSAVLWC